MPSATECPIQLNGAGLFGDPSGALVWRETRTVIVADLHLEKGSSFARRGSLLPPYDTRETLARLAAVLRAHGAARVVCLGDSFHDGRGGERLAAEDARELARLVAAHDWVWVAGNHDPQPHATLGGRICAELTLGPLVCRHAAAAGGSGEISGHFHPTASVRLRAGRVTGRCFVGDARRLVLPAFGAFTGGLDVFDPAIAALFPGGFAVHLLGRDRVMTIPRARLAPSSYTGLFHRGRGAPPS